MPCSNGKPSKGTTVTMESAQPLALPQQPGKSCHQLELGRSTEGVTMSISSRNLTAMPVTRAADVVRAVIFSSALVLPGTASAARSSPPVCRPSDVTTVRTVAHLQRLVTSSTSSDRALKDSLGITATKAGDVAYVTAERTCAKALTAFNTVMATPSQTRQLYVFKIGRDFAVEDPTMGQNAEYRGLRIFSRVWAYKRTYLTY